MSGAVDDILAHYAQVEEERRLEAGIGELERIRTQAIITRHLRPAPGKILDVGGGPGVYARWLAELGYDVELIDPVPRHVSLAEQSLAEIETGRGRAMIGDARDLEFSDESQDAVLLLGPLYHLPESSDRLRCLAEAFRVLRPGGSLIAAALSRFASLMDGFARELVRDPQFVSLLKRDLEDGRHSNPTTNPVYFTTAYLHRPEELAAEVAGSGFTSIELIGVEGPFWCMPSFGSLWAEDSTRALMLTLLDRVEGEPTLLGSSAHILAVGRKPA